MSHPLSNSKICPMYFPPSYLKNLQKNLISTPPPRNKFSPSEDEILVKYVSIYGDNNWKTIAKLMPCRNSRQCRERWKYYLDPNLCRENWSPEEDELLISLHDSLGPKWMIISKSFPRRTDAMIKNRFNMLKRNEKKANTEIYCDFDQDNRNNNNSFQLFCDSRKQDDWLDETFCDFYCEEFSFDSPI